MRSCSRCSSSKPANSSSSTCRCARAELFNFASPAAVSLTTWRRRSAGSLLYYGGADGPSPKYLSFQGLAHVEPAANDEVYAKMIGGERGQDPEREGVAVIVDVESVFGFDAEGPFQLTAGD